MVFIQHINPPRAGKRGNDSVTADILTFCRMVFSFLLLVFQPSSLPFAILYLLCGISDILDGFAARKLHTESEKGARLDSAADLMFAAVYAVRILPLLSIPLWIWIWIALIAAVKVTGILMASRNAHKAGIEHSFGNRLTGLLLFLLPLSVGAVEVKFGAALVCFAATVTGIGELKKAISRRAGNG